MTRTGFVMMIHSFTKENVRYRLYVSGTDFGFFVDQLMCSAWLRFEREHGTLEDYDRAVMKVREAHLFISSYDLKSNPLKLYNLLISVAFKRVLVIV